MATPFNPGARWIERLGSLRTRFAADGLDALLITQPANIRYLIDFKGSAGMLVLTLDDACLVTDSRYATVAQRLVAADAGAAGLRFVQVEWSYEETVCAVLTDVGVSRVGFETAHMTVARHDWLERGLAGSGVTLRGTTGLVESFRQVKDADELATMREAGGRISLVMEQVLQRLRVGRTETIVAGGPNTALPHARPGDRRLAPGDLVLLDFGGIYHGYCVDLTRMASLGTPDPAALAWHAAVSIRSLSVSPS